MTSIELRLAGPKATLAFGVPRRSLEAVLIEAGKNAVAAEATTFWVRIQHDATGRIVSLDLADDGHGLRLDDLQRVLLSPRLEGTGGRRLSWFGLGFATLIANCRRLALRMPESDGGDVALEAADDAGTFRSIGADLFRRPLGRLGTQIQLDGLPPDFLADDADEVLSRLPIGPGFEVRLEDFLGRRDVQPRAHRGESLARGEFDLSWRDGRQTHSAASSYQLNLLDRPPRTGRRAAAAGIDVRRDGLVVDRSIFGIPVRRSEIGRVTGVFDVGDWYPIDAGKLRPHRRRGAARAFAKAARQQVESILRTVARTDDMPDSFRLARISSEITQRLSKAILRRPDLAPVIDRPITRARRRRVLDIPWVTPESDGNGIATSASGLRVRWDLRAGTDTPPGRYDAGTDSILVNYRHPVREQLSASGGGRLEELWGLLVASMVVHDLRTGGAGDLSDLGAILELATLALDESSRPLSTRSQRERDIRESDMAAITRQLEGLERER